MILTQRERDHLAARLDAGLQSDTASLEAGEEALCAMLEQFVQTGSGDGNPAVRNSEWRQHWDRITVHLRNLRGHVRLMAQSLESDGSAAPGSAGEWEKFNAEDAALGASLTAVRVLAAGLDPAVRQEWNRVSLRLGPYLTSLHACACALHLRSELKMQSTGGETEQVVKRLLLAFPDLTGAEQMEAAAADQEMDAAVTETINEKHETTGLRDIFRGLLMYVETPDERVLANREAT